eukprot:9413850-Karenia_brevis.AAC.1
MTSLRLHAPMSRGTSRSSWRAALLAARPTGALSERGKVGTGGHAQTLSRFELQDMTACTEHSKLVAVCTTRLHWC